MTFRSTRAITPILLGLQRREHSGFVPEIVPGFLLGVAIFVSCTAPAAELPVRSDGIARQSIVIREARLPRVPPVSRTAALYFTLQNMTAQTLLLVAVDTPIAAHTMIHLTEERHGVVKMRPQGQLEILAGAKLEFSPGGYHIMLTGLNQAEMAEVRASRRLPLSLVFADGSRVAKTVKLTRNEEE